MKYDEVSKIFRLREGILERFKYGKWVVVNVKASPKRGGYANRVTDSSGGKVEYHRLIWSLANTVDIPNDMVVDHINNDPMDNRIDNLQLLNSMDNTSKDKRFHVTDDVRVHFRVTINGKQVTAFRRSYQDVKEREFMWNYMAEFFLFRQELKGKQTIRNYMIGVGDIAKVKTLANTLADVGESTLRY